MPGKLKDLAVDYWIENTSRIYDENLHISNTVIEAYEAGFKAAKEMALSALYESGSDPTGHGENCIRDIDKNEGDSYDVFCS